MALELSQLPRIQNHVPAWLVIILVFFALATPATAQDNLFESNAQSRLYAIEAAILVFVHRAIVFSGTTVGPLMGITSVLWLVMRNDAAIEPRSSWR